MSNRIELLGINLPIGVSEWRYTATWCLCFKRCCQLGIFAMVETKKMREILFSVGKNGGWNRCHASNILPDAAISKTQVYQWFSRRYFSMIINHLNEWKHFKNLCSNNLGRLSPNNWQTYWFVWCVLEHLPMNFELELWMKQVAAKLVPCLQCTCAHHLQCETVWPKIAWSNLPLHLILLCVAFFFLFPWIKNTQGKMLLGCGRGEEEMTKVLLAITSQGFQGCFDWGKMFLDQCKWRVFWWQECRCVKIN